MLFGGAATGGNAEVHIYVAQFFSGVVAAGTGNGPEIGGVIGNESQLELLGGGITGGSGIVARCRSFILAAACND